MKIGSAILPEQYDQNQPKMKPLPSPREQTLGCVWLPRILEKAKRHRHEALHPDYLRAFCHPAGVDHQFLTFFNLEKADLLAISTESEDHIHQWFTALSSVSEARIHEWNERALNLGRPNQPMEERFKIALQTSYQHVAASNPQTVFEALEIDEGA